MAVQGMGHVKVSTWLTKLCITYWERNYILYMSIMIYLTSVVSLNNGFSFLKLGTRYSGFNLKYTLNFVPPAVVQRCVSSRVPTADE